MKKTSILLKKPLPFKKNDRNKFNLEDFIFKIIKKYIYIY